MERGSAKHGARQDDALADELEGQLGQGGSNREEWADPEPPADDDADPAGGTDGGTAAAGADSQDDAEMRRLQQDMATANDWNPGTERP
jgi:hypothetical protein